MSLHRLLTPASTIFFLCDIQTRFRAAIHGFDEVVATSNKMVKVAKTLGCEVVVTEQNPKALGATVPEIDLGVLGPLHIATLDKTMFSMVTPQVRALLEARPAVASVVLFGIESHVCVLQTALDLVALNYSVHVLADGVSSCNRQEVPYALERIRQAGGFVTTSESAAFQLMRDSATPNFKTFATLIKEEKSRTQRALEVLSHEKSTAS